MKKFLLTAAVAFGALTVARVGSAGEVHLRAGAQEHEQPVLRPGPRRLQEGRSRIRTAHSNACISAPASMAAATSRCRSCRTWSPRRSTASRWRRPTPRPWRSRSRRPRMPASRCSPGTPTCCPRTRTCASPISARTTTRSAPTSPRSPWQIKPKGGTICIQSGGAAAANHNERMQGIRDTLSGKQIGRLAWRPC